MGKITHILFCASLLISTLSKAQTSTYITPENFALLPTSIQEKIIGQVTIGSEIQFERNTSIDPNAEFIKQWSSQHQDIKLISKSYFNSLSEEEKAVYVNNGALVMQAEQLSSDDIKNYLTK